MSKDLAQLATYQHDTQIAIEKHGLPIVEIAQGRLFYRVQLSVYSNPIFYNLNSASRYGDARNELGVCYVAGSDLVAVAESLQKGHKPHWTHIQLKEISERTLHTLITTRALTVVDAAALARNGGQTLEAIVKSRGQNEEGYAYTRILSSAVMRHHLQADGLLYPSRAYSITGSISGCNLVLFDGRATQLAAVRCVPLMDAELSSGETAVELLTRIRVPIE